MTSMEPQPLLSAPAKSLSKRVAAWSRQRRYPDAYGLQGRNLLLLVIVVMAISFLSAFFLREWISGVAVSVAIVGATFLLGRKAYVDNSHVFITQPHWPKAAVAIALGRSASTVKDCSSSGGLGELCSHGSDRIAVNGLNFHPISHSSTAQRLPRCR